MSKAKPHKAKELHGAALASRMNLILAFSALPPSADDKFDEAPEFKREILSYGEKALPHLIDGLKYQSTAETAVSLISKIESKNPGALARNEKRLRAVLIEYIERYWVYDNAASLLKIMRKSLASSGASQNEINRRLNDVFTSTHAHKLAAEGDWNDAVDLLDTISNGMKKKKSCEKAEKELSGMGEKALPYLLHAAKTDDNVFQRGNAVTYLIMLEDKHPGIIERNGGIESAVTSLYFESDDEDIKKKDKLFGTPAAKYLVRRIGIPAIRYLLLDSDGDDRHADCLQSILEEKPNEAAKEILEITKMSKKARTKFGEYSLHMKPREKTIAPLETIMASKNKEVADAAFGLVASTKTDRATQLILERFQLPKHDAETFRDFIYRSREKRNLAGAVNSLLRHNEFGVVERLLKNKGIRSETLAEVVKFAIAAKKPADAKRAAELIAGYGDEAIPLIFEAFKRFKRPKSEEEDEELGAPEFLTPNGPQIAIERAAQLLASFGKEAVPHLRLYSKGVEIKLARPVFKGPIIKLEPGSATEQMISLLALKRLLKDAESTDKFMKSVSSHPFVDIVTYTMQLLGSKGARAKQAAEILKAMGPINLPYLVAQLGLVQNGEQILLNSISNIVISIAKANPDAPEVKASVIPCVVALAKSDEFPDPRVGRAMKIIVGIGEPFFLPLIDATEQCAAKGEYAKYSRLASSLALLINKKKLQERPELATLVPKCIKRLDGTGLEDGSFRILLAFGEPTIPLLYGEMKTSKNRLQYLSVLALFGCRHPTNSIIQGLIPEFADAVEKHGFATSATGALDLNQTIFSKSPFTDATMKFPDASFAYPLAIAGREGVVALLDRAEGASEDGKLRIATALANVLANSKAKNLLAGLEDKVFLLIEPMLKFIDSKECGSQVRSILKNMGLRSVEPIIKHLGRGLQSGEEERCLKLIESIAKANPNAPELKPAIPFFIKNDHLVPLVNFGPQAISFLLAEYKSHPVKAEQISEILDEIKSKVKTIDTGVVAKSRKPSDMQQLLANRAFDVNPAIPQQKLVKVA